MAKNTTEKLKRFIELVEELLIICEKYAPDRKDSHIIIEALTTILSSTLSQVMTTDEMQEYFNTLVSRIKEYEEEEEDENVSE